ncbi:CPXCG motif-containing cysteine-rich protein [Kaarinaea lacus]
MLEVYSVSCPYCGESFNASVDLSVGQQNYIEDCYVCCRPIQFSIDIDYNGELLAIDVRRDDD